MATEATWRDRRIVQVDLKGKETDCYGFKMHQAFRVLDEWDEDALPIVQRTFWSPADAIAAIEMVDIVAPDMKRPKWPTTAQYEFNRMWLYRCNHDLVFHAIHRIRKVIEQARDFDENPSQEILNILNTLNQNMYEKRTA